MDKTPQTNDPVHHPSHYQRGGMECKDAIAAMLTPDQLVGYWYGCLVKYAFRWPAKNSTYLGQRQDIEKLKECANELENALEKKHLQRKASNDAAMDNAQ